MQLSWYHSYFRHDFQMFLDAMNSFNIVRWYTYTCSSIKLNAIKLIFLTLIKIPTNAKYVAPRAEDLNSASKQKPKLRFASYKATHDFNKSRENVQCERFFFFICCCCFFVCLFFVFFFFFFFFAL